MTKTCTKCNIEKPLTDFNKDKKGKHGFSSICKLCIKAYQKAYQEANKDKIREKRKAYREANKDKMKAYYQVNKDEVIERGKAYYEANKDKIREKRKEYYEANKDKAKAYYEANKDKIREKDKERHKAYYEANKDKIREQRKAYREANKDKIKAYREANKEKIRLYQKEWTIKKRKEDPLFKLQKNIRSLILDKIKKKGYTKKSKTYQILGCTYEEFKEHLERQFTKGMTWENYGDWHLDHIYPVSLAENEEELIKLNHYTNFQPLWRRII